LRVPTAVRWPGQIPAGIREQVINNMDWFPTLLAMADVALPQNASIHGRNALPILRGESIDWDNEHYAEYDMRVGAQVQMRAIRSPKWKLMVDYLNPGRVELYDLTSDPEERRNLYPPASERSTSAYRQLSRRLTQKISEVNGHSAELPTGISINFGASHLSAVSPGKPVGKHALPFVNNVLKMSGSIKLDRLESLRDSHGESTEASLSAPGGKYTSGKNSFADWDQVFMQEAAQFAEPLILENLPESLTRFGYAATLHSAAPATGELRINGKKYAVGLGGGFAGVYSDANALTISGLKADALSIQLPRGFKLAGLQIVADK
jgi:hypothetical protein